MFIYGARTLCLFLLIVSICALSIALISQYGFELHPCTLCIWQRWPYVGVIFLTVIALKIPKWQHILLMASLLVLLVGVGIATYHAGVEQELFEGTQSCSNTANPTTSIETLRAQIMASPIALCSQPAAVFLGLSMAVWNAMLCLMLVFIISISLLAQKRTS